MNWSEDGYWQWTTYQYVSIAPTFDMVGKLTHVAASRDNQRLEFVVVFLSRHGDIQLTDDTTVSCISGSRDDVDTDDANRSAIPRTQDGTIQTWRPTRWSITVIKTFVVSLLGRKTTRDLDDDGPVRWERTISEEIFSSHQQNSENLMEELDERRLRSTISNTVFDFWDSINVVFSIKSCQKTNWCCICPRQLGQDVRSLCH